MNKKRKYSQITNQTKLSIQPIDFLNCQICYIPVYNYKECYNHWVYCSNTCFSILYMHHCGNFGNQQTFNDDMVIDYNIADKPIGIISL